MENNLQGGISSIYGSCYQYLNAFSPDNIVLKEDLCALFKPGDIRNNIVFNANPAVAGGKVGPEGKIMNWGWPSDGTTQGSVKRGNLALFKPEEAWLMLAEAQYRTGATNDAIITLNKFKSFRNAGTANGLSGDALLQEIVNERRKEFFGDSDKRWIDLKRFGGKTITRKLRFFNTDYNLKVEPNDYHYALPIPLVEIQQNRNIIPNDGWIIIQY
ncbi:MAG: RagB/SusD family nutrient uptake outer membrane protein [Chitinophagaceae bacterium]|nr:RagB/SusD family nutrient uptake outer membrane protein [Chitinophagaceae bacterium]